MVLWFVLAMNKEGRKESVLKIFSCLPAFLIQISSSPRHRRQEGDAVAILERMIP
jgi:hypothetical protein